jgi:anthranilate synthase component 1
LKPRAQLKDLNLQRTSQRELRITIANRDDLTGALLEAAAAFAPSFVYERTSTRTRRPVRSYIGFGGGVQGSTPAGDAFDHLRARLSAARSRPAMPFCLAFLSYEALIGARAAAGSTPHDVFIEPAILIVLDHEAGIATLSGAYEPLVPVVRKILETPMAASPPAAADSQELAGWLPDQLEPEFVARALALKADIAARHDVSGVTLSVEVEREADVSALDAYRVLRRINPSTCMFLLQTPGFALWGATSLPVLNINGRRIVAETDGATRRVEPGTVGAWQPSAKENSEYDLVVTALREDMQKIVKPGTLNFIADREARQYFNLQHLFAEIEAELEDHVDAVRALQGLTPHGAATGYSKAAAIALIDRYDSKPRGPYAGAIGMLGIDGSADIACVIRSAWKVGSTVRTRAGAKIVAGSDPASEYQESILKTLPLKRSIAVALGEHRLQAGEPEAGACLSRTGM